MHTKLGLLVRMSSPGYSASTSENDLSPLKALGPLDTTGESLSDGEEAIKTHIRLGEGCSAANQLTVIELYLW